MNQKTFTQSAGIIFGLIALLHIFRLVYRWEAVIGGWAVPMWLSWVALAIAGYLAYSSYQLTKK